MALTGCRRQAADARSFGSTVFAVAAHG
jgi:hypothetical protein